MNPFTLGSFIAATAAVALVTRFLVRRMKRSDDPGEEYFTAGRALGWPVVAGSLLLTNLSTEQLVGLNGAVYADGNLVGIAWEVLAAIAMIALALVFLPIYLRSGFATTPAFLEQRFDRNTRSMVSGLFLFGYVTVLLPVVLYTGSLALIGMFDLELPLWAVVLGIALIGSAYAIFGGLKTVAVSDTLNGAGLLVGGLCIPFLALYALGEGSLFSGLGTLVRERPDALASLAQTGKDGQAVSVPWDTLLTGMMMIQVFYWSTNQVIVQRAIGAKSLAEGQKGVLCAAFLKLIGPLMLCLPALIALHMSDRLELPSDPATGAVVADQVYGTLVRAVLPDWSLGLFAAVLVGSILSSFNSALNSASTLFSLQFYEGYLQPRATQEQVVRAGKLFGALIAAGAIVIAPQLGRLESIFEYLQKINGLYSVPIIAIFVIAVSHKRAPAMAAKAGMVTGLAFYAFFTFVVGERLHFLHGYAISFAAAVLCMIIVAWRRPRSDHEIAAASPRIEAPVDMTPWRSAHIVSGSILASVVFIYAALTWLSTS